MNFQRLIRRAFPLLLLLLAVGLGCVGCATTDDAENASSKPWNSPEGWQNGVMGNYLNRPH